MYNTQHYYKTSVTLDKRIYGNLMRHITHHHHPYFLVNLINYLS